MSDPILANVEGAVLTLTFNRIEKKNAITTAMYSALADALTEAARTARLHDFLNSLPGRASSLYIVGDLFEVVPALAEAVRICDV